MMKLPQKINVNGVIYSVKIKHGLNDGESVLYGEFDSNNEVINLNPDIQCDQGMIRTFLHEMCHAILHENDVGNYGYNSRVPKDEEVLCEMYSRSLYQILTDNPNIFSDKE